MFKSWIWLSILVIVLDQATKYLAETWHLVTDVPLLELSSFKLNLVLTHNTGVAFSLCTPKVNDICYQFMNWISTAFGFSVDSLLRGFFLIFGVSVSIGLIVWLRRLKLGEPWLAAALALILGGAVGNLIDRALLGKVIDFIEIYYAEGWPPWPAFNIADSAITIGAVLLIADSLWPRKASRLKNPTGGS